MKTSRLVLSSVALCISMAAFSQADTTIKSKKDTLVKTDTTMARMQHAATGSNSNAMQQTAQSSAAADPLTLPKPNFGRYYIAVLGAYQSSQTGSGQSVTVTGDETNPGKVWVEGLTPAKFYGLLKTPGTYKIPAQMQDKQSIAEGAITYDETSKQITICVGCGFSGENTTVIVANEVPAVKSKKSKAVKTVINFTGTKVNQGNASAF